MVVETLSPIPFIDGMKQILKFAKKPIIRNDFNREEIDTFTFLEACKQHSGLVLFFCFRNKIHIQIHVSRPKKKLECLLDTTLLAQSRKEHDCFVFCILDSIGAQLKLSKISPKTYRFKIDRRRLQFECGPLYKLLDVSERSNPTSFQETVEFLQDNHLLDKVSILVVLSPKTGVIEQWHYCERPNDTLYVFPNGDALGSLSFGKYIPMFPLNAKLKDYKKEKNHKELMTHKQNKKASVSVLPMGLNLARRLGAFLSLIEFKEIACQLLHENVFLFLQTIKKDEYVLSFKCGETIKSYHVCTYVDWIGVFEFIRQQQQVLYRQKSAICKKLFTYLLSFQHTNVTSLFSSCYRHTLKMCQMLNVFLFDPTGISLHILKHPFLQHLAKAKGVRVVFDRNNDIVGLFQSNVYFFNVAELTNSRRISPEKRNGDALWRLVREMDITPIPQRIFFPIRRRLHLNYLYLRGRQHVGLIESVYVTFCKKFLTSSHFDINTCRFKSLSLMSYHLIWHMYIEQHEYAFLFHPIEKVSQATEQRLRSVCKGGFSFSIQQEFQFGAPLNAYEDCASVVNYDLSSSYGYAASNALLPTGFGIVYENGQPLTRTLRSRGFEFRAVFKVIYDYYTRNYPIVGVFSNFSPLGIFYVGKYPIDLVIICANGKIDMFQMDGKFCHGCTNPKCTMKVTRYANDQTADEVIEKTRLRDQFITQWKHKSQLDISYFILRDCCSDNFQIKYLTREFKTTPILNHFISGYDRLTSDDVTICPEELTFLSVVDIECVIPQMTKFGPLMIRNDADATPRQLFCQINRPV